MSIILNGFQLQELLEFTAPDREQEPEQLETEIVLTERQAFTSTDGDDMPAGLYMHYVDYPEEGVILIEREKTNGST